MPSAAGDSPPPSAKTVLVVDDDPLVRFDVSIALEDRGHRAVQASDGEEALERFEAASPALVVTDIYMPGIDGLALIRHLRRQGATAQILAMSDAKPGYDVLAIALKIGANATITKPFAVSELIKAVEELLSAPPSRPA